MFRSTFCAVLVVAVACLSGCDNPVAPAETTPLAAPVSFGEGFYKEEATGSGSFRWVRQSASLTINAPEDGNFEVTFQPVTVFSPAENVIAISANGQPAGTVSTHAFDLANPPGARLNIPLKKGENVIALKSDSAEKRLSPDDDRTPAFGLVLPLTVKR